MKKILLFTIFFASSYTYGMEGLGSPDERDNKKTWTPPKLKPRAKIQKKRLNFCMSFDDLTARRKANEPASERSQLINEELQSFSGSCQKKLNDLFLQKQVSSLPYLNGQISSSLYDRARRLQKKTKKVSLEKKDHSKSKDDN